MAATELPRMTDRALAEAQARKAREAEALRENLRRRKAQARARATDDPPASDNADARHDEIG